MPRRRAPATTNRSFRLPVQLHRRLGRRARETGESVNALAARYLDESLRMDDHPQVAFWTRPGGRQAMLRGHRLSVADVVETVRSTGGASAAAEYLSLAPWEVEACLRYYADFADEVDAEIREAHEIAEREQAAFERSGALGA